MSMAGPHQRQYARILLRDCNLPTDVITLMHRRAWQLAGIPEATHGARVDATLSALTAEQAKALITALKTIKGDA